MSEKLLGKLKVIAWENQRSANKEIVHILSAYVKKYEEKNGKVDVEIK
ncbi:MAG: hypothetical protein VB081_04330 [Christensenella sp.]|nr:hypothetical protein [Christensenella sp.]MEA5002704.1 hypothetical protein [Christensenella sp.]